MDQSDCSIFTRSDFKLGISTATYDYAKGLSAAEVFLSLETKCLHILEFIFTGSAYSKTVILFSDNAIRMIYKQTKGFRLISRLLYTS